MTEKDPDYRDAPKNYMYCSYARCSQAANCLRYQAFKHISDDMATFMIVNSAYIIKLGGDCQFFRLNKQLRFAAGITHLFDNIPHAKAVEIRDILYNYFKRNMFYRIRNKERLISVEEQAFIRDVFRKKGFPGEPVFDEYVYKFAW